MNTHDIVLGLVVMAISILIPGCSLANGLFNRKNIGTAWFIGLSIFLGLIPPLIVYALNKNFSVPITTQTSLLTVAFVTCVGIILWWDKQKRKD